MTDSERLAAIEDIKQLKARYWRGVDSSDGALVRAILAPDCELDYIGCCTDPSSGQDFMPAMNVVLKGRDSWISDAFAKAGIITVHQGYQNEITVSDRSQASGIWVFADRFFLPPGGAFTRLTGYGHYHDTYTRADDGWKLQTTRITRLWVEVA